MSFLQVKNVGKSYGQVKVLKDISIDIEKGEFICLLGPSGCGKSTLLRIIAGLEDKHGGKIIINDKDMTNSPPESRNFGIVFQSYALFPNMNVEDNIRFPLKLRKIPIDEQILKANHLSKLMQIEDIKNRYPKNLSGGEKQRVAFARALIAEPDILLLDEPMSSLDYITKKHISKILKDVYIKYKPTVIHVTHDISEAMFFAHKIGIMNNGKINHIFDLNEEIKNKGESFFYEYI